MFVLRMTCVRNLSVTTFYRIQILNGNDTLPDDICTNDTILSENKPFIVKYDDDPDFLGCADKTLHSKIGFYFGFVVGGFVILSPLLLMRTPSCIQVTIVILDVLLALGSACLAGFDFPVTIRVSVWLDHGLQDLPFENPPHEIKPYLVLNNLIPAGEALIAFFLFVLAFVHCCFGRACSGNSSNGRNYEGDTYDFDRKLGRDDEYSGLLNPTYN